MGKYLAAPLGIKTCRLAGDRIISKDAVSNYNESDLHVPLVSWLISTDHFKCRTKTITQQTAKKTVKGIDQWTFPDLIGVYFPYEDLLVSEKITK